jgi:hypothetical protein
VDGAVLAYLHVPVFETETLDAPPLSARTRSGGLEDLERATKSLNDLTAEYPKSAQAEIARAERRSCQNEKQNRQLLPNDIEESLPPLRITGKVPALATPGFSVYSPAAPPAGVQSKTLWEQIKEGGWVMFPIALCSIATLYLIGDGILRTSRKKAAPPEQEEALKTLFRQGDYVGAHNYCKTNPSPLTMFCGRDQPSRRGTEWREE